MYGTVPVIEKSGFWQSLVQGSLTTLEGPGSGPGLLMAMAGHLAYDYMLGVILLCINCMYVCIYVLYVCMHAFT